MSFFAQEAGKGPATPRRLPAWLRPPANVIPVVVPLGLVLARNQDAALAIPAVEAYPAGLGLMLVVRVGLGAGGHRPQHGLLTHDPTSEEFVRLGVQFSDGRTATNLRRPLPPRAGEPPAGPLLTPHGGSGSDAPGIPPTGCGRCRRLVGCCLWPSGRRTSSARQGQRSMPIRSLRRQHMP